MTKGNWRLFSGVLILTAILILILKFILKFNINIIDDFTGAILGVGIGILLFTLFKKKNT
jgi:uncharacterized BrkB/YihY/UPF0761 family membrane protein